VEIEVELPIEQFKILYNLPTDTNTIICIGGRGGAKTYEVSKFIAFQATIKKKRCVILRDEKSLIKDTILNEILLRYDTANSNNQLDRYFERLKSGISERKTGKELVYTKGFRASALEKKANMKGVSDIDIAAIEECEDLRSEEEFDTFIDGLRKEGCLVIVMMNVPDIGHFLIKRYFILETTEHNGYFKLSPKNIPGVVCIQTGYQDNPFLPQHIIDRYKGYGDPNHHMYNLHHFLTAIQGYASTGRKGQILTKVKAIKLADYLALPFKEIYGQDFGTASPAGLVGLKFDKNNCYIRQLNYLPKSTLDIAKMYCTLGFGSTDKIVADSADPLSIDKLKVGYRTTELPDDVFVKHPRLANGFYIIPCVKGQGSVEYGLGLMDSMVLHAVEESADLWHEIYNYVYAQDKNGNYTNEPIDEFNHLIDPARYVIMDYKGYGSGKVSTGKPAPSKNNY
jgi:phage terminase large subunit